MLLHERHTIRLASRIDNLTMSEQDKAPGHELAVRNQDDAFIPAEKKEMRDFRKAATVLTIFKSKARRTLGVKLKTRNVR